MPSPILPPAPTPSPATAQSLVIRRGRSYALVGRNRSGKSTLVHALCKGLVDVRVLMGWHPLSDNNATSATSAAATTSTAATMCDASASTLLYGDRCAEISAVDGLASGRASVGEVDTTLRTSAYRVEAGAHRVDAGAYRVGLFAEEEEEDDEELDGVCVAEIDVVMRPQPSPAAAASAIPAQSMA